MSTFVESLKRLYSQNLITKEKVLSYVVAEKITQEEYNYVIGGN